MKGADETITYLNRARNSLCYSPVKWKRLKYRGLCTEWYYINSVEKLAPDLSVLWSHLTKLKASLEKTKLFSSSCIPEQSSRTFKRI